MKRVCVFCGSSPGGNPNYRVAAQELGAALPRRGLGLVYGGGNVGLMGVLADAVLEAGGTVLGVIPRALAERELAHHGIQDLRIVGSMHERKALMADNADAFVALPGGLGTLDEFFEVLTWAQLGIHAKPCGLLNVAGYYDALNEFIATSVRERFVRPEHRDMILLDERPDALLDRMARWTAPRREKWIDRSAV